MMTGHASGRIFLVGFVKGNGTGGEGDWVTF